MRQTNTSSLITFDISDITFKWKKTASRFALTVYTNQSSTLLLSIDDHNSSTHLNPVTL